MPDEYELEEAALKARIASDYEILGPWGRQQANTGWGALSFLVMVGAAVAAMFVSEPSFKALFAALALSGAVAFLVELKVQKKRNRQEVIRIQAKHFQKEMDDGIWANLLLFEEIDELARAWASENLNAKQYETMMVLAQDYDGTLQELVDTVRALEE